MAFYGHRPPHQCLHDRLILSPHTFFDSQKSGMRRGVSDKMRDSDPQTQMVVPIENIEKYAETRFHEIFLDICVFETIVGRGFD